MFLNSIAKDTEDEELFLSSEKVVLIVNVLTKYNVKLWEMDDVGASESKQIEVCDFCANFLFI